MSAGYDKEAARKRRGPQKDRIDILKANKITS